LPSPPRSHSHPLASTNSPAFLQKFVSCGSYITLQIDFHHGLLDE
jgi:hypothetical protein